MTNGQLLGFTAVTALMFAAAAPTYATGGGHGGHGGHGGGHGGHGHAVAHHVAHAGGHGGHGGHAHVAAHVASHVHHNGGVGHAVHRNFAANRAVAHNYAGWNRAGWNHYGWNRYGWNRGFGYANRGWWGPGYWGRRYGLWGLGYWNTSSPVCASYGYADPAYYYQYYNNVSLPSVAPAITSLTGQTVNSAIEPGALTVPPAPAELDSSVSDQSVADSANVAPVLPSSPTAAE
jgi:hypothetical protein